MTTTSTLYFDLQAAQDLELQQLFASNAFDIAVLLHRFESSGIVPQSAGNLLIPQAQHRLTSIFLATQKGNLQAFQVNGGELVPLTPFTQILWANIRAATELAVSEHGAIIRKKLARYPDLLQALSQATLNPFQAAKKVAELDGNTRRKLQQYDPQHLWVDPSGYTLSDRIWQTNSQMRRKLNLFLREAIAEGRSAKSIARDLTNFLNPTRGLIRTNKPYGTNLSFDAMRLARTELASAFNRAGLMAAHLNPFVTGVDVARSPGAGPCTTHVCDAVVAGNPYTLDTVPNIPGDTHPHCLCTYRWRMETPIEDVVQQLGDELRAMRAGMMPPEDTLMGLIGPLMGALFARLLMQEQAPLEETMYDY